MKSKPKQVVVDPNGWWLLKSKCQRGEAVSRPASTRLLLTSHAVCDCGLYRLAVAPLRISSRSARNRTSSSRPTERVIPETCFASPVGGGTVYQVTFTRVNEHLPRLNS